MTRAAPALRPMAELQAALFSLDMPPTAPAEDVWGPAPGLNPRHPFDPRPDLAGDQARWVGLLAAAWDVDGLNPAGVYGALYGMRCCGAQLVSADQPGAGAPANWPRWRLLPGAELAQAEWLALRAKWLAPHQIALTRLGQG